MSQSSVNVKLPFGLKNDRIYHISEVANGLSCGCICPNCAVQLVAKNKGFDKAHHFAHYQESECKGSLETAIHLMAKQVIENELEICTPIYEKSISLVDDENVLYEGKTAHIESANLKLDKVDTEVSKEGYRPDIIAFVKRKTLNIEIKVSHAVDEKKRKLIKSIQEPMFEIDLSDLTEETLLDLEKFKSEVLKNVDNRHWINNPKGDSISDRNMSELKQKVEKINNKIRQRKKLRAQKQEKFEKLKQVKRKPYLENLEKLKQTDAEWIYNRKAQLLDENKILISNNLKQIDYKDEYGKYLFTDKIKSDWIFKVHPKAWQSAIFLKYIYNRPVDSTFKANDVKKWVVKRFGVLKFVEELNIVKQKHKEIGNKRNKWYAEKGSWFFTDTENSMIISPFKPIIDYLNYLAELTILETSSDNPISFKIKYNTLPDYGNYVHELERYKTLQTQLKGLGKELEDLLNKRKVTLADQTRKKMIACIIKSEKRAFETYGEKVRSCRKCYMASSVQDSITCPFCGHHDFKQIELSEEYLGYAKHKHECNSSINKDEEFFSKLNLSLLDDFE